MARRRNAQNPDIKPRFLKLAVALKEAREHAGLSQQACAKLLGVSTSTLSTYELGVRSIPASRLLTASQVLNDRGLAQLAPLGGKRRSPDVVARVTAALASVFVRSAFTRWWAARSHELCDECPTTEQSDLDSAKSALVRWVTVDIQELERKHGAVTEDAVMKLCDDHFPSVRRLLKQLVGSQRDAA